MTVPAILPVVPASARAALNSNMAMRVSSLIRIDRLSLDFKTFKIRSLNWNKLRLTEKEQLTENSLKTYSKAASRTYSSVCCSMREVSWNTFSTAFLFFKAISVTNALITTEIAEIELVYNMFLVRTTRTLAA